MDFSCKPINPYQFQDDGLSKEDRAMINGMRETAYICGKRGGDVEHAVHQTLKRMGRYDLLPPCERESEDKSGYFKEECPLSEKEIFNLLIALIDNMEDEE